MNLSDLPEDLLLAILGFLDIRNSTRLLQTCKRLQLLAGIKSLWLPHVKVLITSHHLDPSSFDLSSAAAARTAAINPLVFVHQIHKENLDARKVVQSTLCLDDEVLDDVQLIPGGRWLVTVHSPRLPGKDGFLRVWDLFTVNDGEVMEEPFASTTVNRWSRCGSMAIRINPDHDKETLLYVYSIQHVWPGDAELVIFRFDGMDELSPLRTVQKVIVPSSVGPTGTMAAQGDYVVFERVLSQHEPIVWSRTANKFAVYHLQNTNIGSKISFIGVSNTGLLVWNRNDLSIDLYGGPINVGEDRHAQIPITLPLIMRYDLRQPFVPDIGQPASFMIDLPGTSNSTRRALFKFTGGLLDLDIDITSSATVSSTAHQMVFLETPYHVGRTADGHSIALAKSFRTVCLMLSLPDRVVIAKVPPLLMKQEYHHFMCPITGVIGGLGDGMYVRVCRN